MKKFLSLAVVAWAWCLTMTGCMDLQYTGQTFPQEDKYAAVAFYTPDDPMPPDAYRMIGRATLKAQDGTSKEELQEKLVDCARKHGADAVAVMEMKRVKLGMRSMNVSTQENGPSGGWARDSRNLGGAYLYSNSFGQVQSLESAPEPVYEIQLKALFGVTKERFETLTKENQKILQEDIEELDAAQKTETEKLTDWSLPLKKGVTIPEIQRADQPEADAKVEFVGAPATLHKNTESVSH